MIYYYVKSIIGFIYFLEEKTGSFDVGDPNTTNIYLGNINPKVIILNNASLFVVYCS